ncbi:MAG: hypothetical protein E6Q97_04370 [Desulfurellales bacterium]|nr:MAG: hypothetical protein E6Q97_04370 [Desulfurellales bacterium]
MTTEEATRLRPGDRVAVFDRLGVVVANTPHCLCVEVEKTTVYVGHGSAHLASVNLTAPQTPHH